MSHQILNMNVADATHHLSHQHKHTESGNLPETSNLARFIIDASSLN